MALRKLTDESIMQFGKYKGQKIKDVPDEYLDWVMGQEWFLFYVQLHNYILENLTAIQKSVEVDEKDLPY